MHIKIDKCEELIVHNHAHSCSSLSKYFTPPVFLWGWGVLDDDGWSSISYYKSWNFIHDDDNPGWWQ